MSYVECLNNRYGMDIPLTYCIWLSELGVEMLRTYVDFFWSQ